MPAVVSQSPWRAWEPGVWITDPLLIWELLVRALRLPSHVLTAPSEFLLCIAEYYRRCLFHGALTAKLILYGFVADTLPGIAVGYLISSYRICEQLLHPLVAFIRGIPRITLALPLAWFRFTNFSKIFLMALVTFFPVLVGSASGFKSVDRKAQLPDPVIRSELVADIQAD